MRALGHWLSLLGKIISHVNWNEIYLPKYPGTVPIGNSDTIGNLEKSQCKQYATYCVTLSDSLYNKEVQLKIQSSFTVTDKVCK